MKKALRVLVGGATEELDLDSPEGSLKVLQNGVKFDDLDTMPLVEPVDLSEQMTMWCHEEGLVLGQPRNEVGSIMAEAVYGPGRAYIVGNIVFTGGTDEEGETLGLDEGLMANMRRLANTIWDVRNKV